MSECASALPEGPCVLRALPEQKAPVGFKIGIPVTIRDTARREGIDYALVEWKKGSIWIWVPSSCIDRTSNEAAA